MKCEILFSGKNKKNIISLSSAENAQRVVKVKLHSKSTHGILIFPCYFDLEIRAGILPNLIQKPALQQCSTVWSGQVSSM